MVNTTVYLRDVTSLLKVCISDMQPGAMQVDEPPIMVSPFGSTFVDSNARPNSFLYKPTRKVCSSFVIHLSHNKFLSQDAAVLPTQRDK